MEGSLETLFDSCDFHFLFFNIPIQQLFQRCIQTPPRLPMITLSTTTVSQSCQLMNVCLHCVVYATTTTMMMTIDDNDDNDDDVR